MTNGRRSILVVDDGGRNSAGLDPVLGDRYELRRARTGEEALAALRRLPAAIVLLDLRTPDLDGFETCRRITSDPALASTSVVLVTDRSSHADRRRAGAVGASDYFAPSDPEDLAARVGMLAALKAAEDEARARSDFVANISHEIRTPMTTILGYSENLRDGSLPEADRRQAIDTIWRNGQHLLELVNNVLDLSKIDAGGMTVERAECRPAEIVAEVLEMLHPRAQGRGIALDARLEGEVPVTILSDRTRLRQILVNLVGNGLKFTEKGGVTVVVRMCRDAGGSEPLLAIEVSDTGIGIEPAQIQMLCQPFVQASPVVTRRFGGSGLGLSISRRLARLLGGDLAIHSQPGQGSRFTVTVATGPLDGVETIPTLPPAPWRAVPVHADAQAGGNGTPLKSRRILLAEDGPDNQRLISFVLRKAGADIVVVKDGKMAIDAILSPDGLSPDGAGPPFDAILMDMEMPVLDGFTATARLRASGYAGPIVGLTAHTAPEERRRCFDAGCDAFATKPLDRPALIRTLLELVERRR